MSAGQAAWGFGGPKLLPPVTTDQYERVVGFFDMHRMQHDPMLWEAAKKVVAEVQPHRVIYGGDIGDNSLISRWEEKKRLGMPQGKVARMVDQDLGCIGDAVFGEIHAIVPEADLHFVEGNHDERARRWYDDELHAGVKAFRKAMKLDDYDVKWHSRSGLRLRPEFIVKHGDYTTLHNAKKEHESSMCGGWSGHKHKWTEWDSTHHETDRRWHWTVAPVMCRLDYDYGPGQSGKAPWPQGFLVGTFGTYDQYDYHTDVARYWRGKLMFRGKVYR